MVDCDDEVGVFEYTHHQISFKTVQLIYRYSYELLHVCMSTLRGMRLSPFAMRAYSHVIFITDGPAVCNNVGAALLKQCCTTSDSPCDGLVDCCIVVSTGQRLYCHKVILSCRSTALRLMLQDEERLEDNSDTTVELLMPELQHEVAQGLLQYIYTDSICASHVSTPMLTFGLMEAATRLGLSNLVEICRKRLDDDADGEGSLRTEESSLLVESTFARNAGTSTMLDALVGLSEYE